MSCDVCWLLFDCCCVLFVVVDYWLLFVGCVCFVLLVLDSCSLFFCYLVMVDS